MRVIFDERIDAAYIQPADEIGDGAVTKTYICDPSGIGGMINLDFNSAGVLIGIEVLGAKSKLPPEVIAASERYE